MSLSVYLVLSIMCSSLLAFAYCAVGDKGRRTLGRLLAFWILGWIPLFGWAGGAISAFILGCEAFGWLDRRRF